MEKSEAKSKNNKSRKLSLIQNFLCTCAGVDKEILKQCPSEWNKYSGIGATILFTGTLAALSGGYALYTVFRSGDLSQIDTNAIIPAILFGILWGFIIFNLDRFIVSTFRKSESDSWRVRLGKDLLQALPRIILAIIIAIVISKPIEVKIFENRLAEQIKENEKNSKEKNASDFDKIYKVSDIEKENSNLKTDLSNLQKELSTDPPNVIKLINEDLARANDILNQIKKNNSQKIANHRNRINSIRNNQSNYRPTFDDEGNVVNSHLTKQANDRIRQEKNAIGILNGEIRKQEIEVNKINNQIEEARKNHREQKQKEIKNKQSQITNVEINLENAKQKAKKETDKANIVSERAFTNNFITQLEALGDLTKSDKTMWWVSIMITLLFMTIEMAPIFTKLITGRGPYDEILDRVEYEIMVEQKEIISQKNSEINELLSQAEEAAKLKGKVYIQSQKDKLDVELKNNKIMLDKIAEYQQDLALAYIDNWYKSEKIKVESMDEINLNSTSKVSL